MKNLIGIDFGDGDCIDGDFIKVSFDGEKIIVNNGCGYTFDYTLEQINKVKFYTISEG
jgi:hypothetical protein